MVNYSPVLESVISDIEVEHQEINEKTILLFEKWIQKIQESEGNK
mgnify:CR=1 FL=1